ncbi:MAG: hypothetical protein KF773_04335 [Deltaproteobacteria bacterium]|nr:hypothetical protein [Deltaproteobacteria bacterium]MCW5807046.1 hypothetical protein [Deltaproteobacteria bacterium]
MRTALALIALAALTSLTAPAAAESQADLAARLNEEGKELMLASKFGEATRKFREAVARVPEPKYFFNLCTSLFQEGRFAEAIVACEAVATSGGAPELRAKADKLAAKVRDEARAQHVDVTPVTGSLGPPACSVFAHVRFGASVAIAARLGLRPPAMTCR